MILQLAFMTAYVILNSIPVIVFFEEATWESRLALFFDKHISRGAHSICSNDVVGISLVLCFTCLYCFKLCFYNSKLHRLGLIE